MERKGGTSSLGRPTMQSLSILCAFKVEFFYVSPFPRHIFDKRFNPNHVLVMQRARGQVGQPIWLHACVHGHGATDQHDRVRTLRTYGTAATAVAAPLPYVGGWRRPNWPPGRSPTKLKLHALPSFQDTGRLPATPLSTTLGWEQVLKKRTEACRCCTPLIRSVADPEMPD